MKALDKQVAGDHYKKLAIQPVEYCHRNGLVKCDFGSGFIVTFIRDYEFEDKWA